MRLVFMGTPAFAVPSLAALIDAGHEIIAVYSQPPRPAGRGQKETPSPVHQFALEKQLQILTPTSLKSSEVQAQFAQHKADAAVVAAYGLLLPKPILEAYPLGCINIHPSLLPRWRGAAPLQRTIMAGDKETGIVIMQMDAGLDTGDMLLVEKYPVSDGTTTGQLHDALSQKAGPLLIRALEGLGNQSITAQKQPLEGVTYAKKIEKSEAHIDWNQPAQQIRQQILGLNPAPGAFFRYGDEAIKIFEAACEPAEIRAAAGTVIDNQLGIACAEGILRPTLLQRPGKKRVSLSELLNGFSIPAGSVLS
jgi:methionyl-tRNA formyltransferase